jgi:hypothetical protein
MVGEKKKTSSVEIRQNSNKSRRAEYFFDFCREITRKSWIHPRITRDKLPIQNE